MENEKRLIDANALEFEPDENCIANGVLIWGGRTGGKTMTTVLHALKKMVDNAPTVDAVEVDTVIEMFEYMLGDCPCNFSPVDEWLAERCELQDECPNPKDKRGCWKQFIKHFVTEMDGDGDA